MNLKHLLTLAALCLCVGLSGQIKIGDNPQNLDATSVLELESNDRVLVITRISEAQMNSLVPLQGAMVYNTDAQCIFYFDGAAWINLCDSLGLNFTTDPIVNTASTIVITENGDDVNFEVGEISSENILDFSINSNDIQNNSITADKLAPDSVGSEELQDNTVTDAEIDYNLVTLNDFFNDAGFITGANIVSGNANNAITDNGGAYYDDSQLVSDVAANTAAIAADGDTNATNELQSLSINADQLTITGGNTVTIPTADGSDTNIQGGTNINVTGNGTGGNPYVINNTFAEIDASISNELQDLQFNAGTNILTLSNPATPGNQVDLSALAGGGGSTELADQITIVGTGTLGDEFEVGDGAIGSIKIIDGTIMPVDLANNAVETAKILDANVTPIKIAPSAINNQVLTTIANTVVWADVPAGGNPAAADVTFTPTGNTVSTDVQAAVEELQTEIDGISAGGAANPNDELNTAFVVNVGNLEITDAGGTLSVPITSIDTDDQDASQVTYDNTTSGLTATDTQAAIDEIAAAGGGNPTDELNTTFAVNAGNLEIIDAGGTLSVPLTSIDTDDQDASQVTYDNTTSGLTAIDTQAAIDEIAAASGVVVSADVPNSIVAGTDGGALYDDPDNDATNEIQDLAEVLTEGADANATIITNLADPVAAQDAATKAYVDANIAGHTGTPNSIFFADASGVPTEDNQGLYWDPAGRTFFGGDTGALYVGIDGNPQSNKAKMHIGEDLNTDVAYPLQIQNFGGGLNVGTSVGVLFAVDDNDTFGKGALVYERNLSNSRGDFHFLQDQNTDSNNPILTDAVVTIKNNGDMGIGTTTPAEKLHVNGNFQLDGNLIAQNGAGNLNDVLTITAAGTEWAPAGAANDNQTAAEVPYDNTLSGFTSTNTQDVIDEIITNIPLDDQTAAEVSYDNTLSGLTAGNAQDAIDEIVANTPLDDQTAAEVSYDNTLSGLTAITTQAAIDEIVANIPADDQNASEVAVATTPTNYTAGSADVEAHLAGIDAALAGGGGANLSNTNLQQTAVTDRTYGLNNGNLIFNENGNIGIGGFGGGGGLPATPQDKLDVDGQVRARNGFAAAPGTSALPSYGFYTNNDNDTGMFRAAEDQMGFSTGGFQAIHIDENQNVGIGTSAPTSILETAGSFATAIESTLANLTLDENNHTVILGGNHTITLPPASNCQGRFYIIKNPTGNTPGITNFLDNAGNAASQIPATSILWLQSDGTNWQQIN